jgi:hypothetical protein
MRAREVVQDTGLLPLDHQATPMLLILRHEILHTQPLASKTCLLQLSAAKASQLCEMSILLTPRKSRAFSCAYVRARRDPFVPSKPDASVEVPVQIVAGLSFSSSSSCCPQWTDRNGHSSPVSVAERQ